VLPDEASLAMILAHELATSCWGTVRHQTGIQRPLFFPDEASFQNLAFKRSEKEEQAADAKALEMLKNSPIQRQARERWIVLKALQEKRPDLPNLLHSHLGNSIADRKTVRMASLMASAPALESNRTRPDCRALPLGGRIRVDPWSDQVELAKGKPVALNSAREKMPFEITPVFPYLTRLSSGGTEKVALTTTGSQTQQK
jgi:hypothetical protein